VNPPGSLMMRDECKVIGYIESFVSVVVSMVVVG
jgi:hypothetical protein